MTEAEVIQHAEMVIVELYKMNHPHETTEADLGQVILKGLNDDDKPVITRFLLSQSMLCDKKFVQRDPPFNKTSYIFLSDLGLKVMSEYDGSYVKYRKDIKKKERMRLWTFILAIIAATTGVLSLFQDDIRQYIYDSHLLTPTNKPKQEEQEKTTRTEEESIKSNQQDYHQDVQTDPSIVSAFGDTLERPADNPQHPSEKK